MPRVSLELPQQAEIHTVSAPEARLLADIKVCRRSSCGCVLLCCVPLRRGAGVGSFVLREGSLRVSFGKLLLQGEN